MRICHISSSKRPPCAGGVAKFAYYLKKAIPELEILYRDEALPNKYDIIIADGYAINDFAGRKDTKLISVVHGSIKEFALRTKTENNNIGPIKWQHEAWNKSHITKVAVSESAAHYVSKHHGAKVEVIIPNGVDTSLFVPKHSESVRKPLVIDAANDYNKNAFNRLGEIQKLAKDSFDFEYLGAAIGEEHIKMVRGDIAIQPSLYEGNSYFLLEAMACDLPVVVSKCGLAEFSLPNTVGEIIDWTAPASDFVAALNKVWDNYTCYSPREWVLENASFEQFAKKWISLIKGL